jgi:NAD(P)-dependent dehydrogenase (short-subunit alcohol dehydrogenase family)
MALAGGAKVVTIDVNQDALSALRGSAGSSSDRLMVETMDVTDAGAIEATLMKARDTFGVVDGLVCCAGVSIEAPLMEVTPELWRRHIDLNLAGTFNVAHSVARDLVANGKTGSIVTISSAQGFRGRQHSAPYVASKAGVFAGAHSHGAARPAGGYRRAGRFLLSDAAGWMTGQTLHVNGGSLVV